jgi:hypothetical protein
MDMDFRRTLKKRRAKKHVPVRVDVVTPAGDRKVLQVQESGKTQPNGKKEGSPKTSKKK